jgi:hypothetical protein
MASDIHDAVKDLSQVVESEIRLISKEKVLAWLERSNPHPNHLAAVEKHQKSTGSWLLESDPFSTWIKNPAAPLWLHGIPGSGKTILISTVIESLKVDRTADSLLFYYFDFGDPAKQITANLMRSLLTQAAVLDERAYQSVLQFYLSCDRGRREPSTSDVRLVLMEIAAVFKELFIVIDALDECPRDGGREELLQDVIEISKIGNVHLLVSSREESDIHSSFSKPGFLDISVAGSGIDSDIREYVKTRFAEDTKLSRFPADLKSEAETQLQGKANGM